MIELPQKKWGFQQQNMDDWLVVEPYPSEK